MFQLNYKLAGLLLLQLIAAAAIYLFTQQDASQNTRESLLSLSKAKIDKLEISGDEQTVVLQKQNDQWILPELHDLPVNSVKLNTVLDNLNALQTGWPIATTKGSHQRFKVTEDNYQRRIKLFQDNQVVADFFLGTSPGFRKVHLRKNDEDEVYSMELNTYDFPTKNNDWLNRKLLAVNNIKTIEGSDFKLRQGDSQWLFAEDNANTVDEDKAKRLMQAFNGLTVSDVVNEKPELSDSQKTVYTVENERQFTFTFFNKESNYYVKRDDKEQLFTLTKYEFERFTNHTKEALTLKQEQSSETQSVASQEVKGSSTSDKSSTDDETLAEDSATSSDIR